MLDLSNKFFTRKVVEHLNKLLHTKLGNAPFLETMKARMDGALGKLILLKMPLLIAGGLELYNLQRPLTTQTIL